VNNCSCMCHTQHGIKFAKVGNDGRSAEPCCSCPAGDPVHHLAHYNCGKARCQICHRRIETIDITEHMDFLDGNVVKYVWRYKHKNGLEDLRKARWYLDRLINKLEKEQELLPDPRLADEDTEC